MKQVEITIRLDCRDDVPTRVIDWMADTLEAYASGTFRGDAVLVVGEVVPGPLIEGDVVVTSSPRMSRPAFLHWLNTHRSHIAITGRFQVRPCECADVNCKGWRLVRTPWGDSRR